MIRTASPPQQGAGTSTTRRLFATFLVAVCALALATPATAQLHDLTQAPNPENVGIKKSLADQVGAGQGDEDTPGSSAWIIARDPFRAVARGRQLFQRKFTVAQGFGPLTGDGVGDIVADGSIGAGLVDSCAGCHGRPRGSAGHGGNVFTRPDSRDAPHLFGLGLVEMLADEITRDLRAQRNQAILAAQINASPVTVVLASKGISYGSLTAHSDGSVDTMGLEGVDGDLRVKPFFAEGSAFSIRQFTVGALNAEMGLESPDPMLLAAHDGQTVVTAGGLVIDGSVDDPGPPPVSDPSEDSDGDGVVNEIDPALVDHLEVYLLNYFKPGTYRQDNLTKVGFMKMEEIGCTQCHIRSLTIDSDRRVADVDTVYDPTNGVFNRLFATAAGRFVQVPDPENPQLPPFLRPAGDSFVVENIFTDLKRHDLGPTFWERNFDGTLQKEFVTEPLWGVGTTPPYGHDGRSISLNEVILRHGGEAQAARDAYAALNESQVARILAALDSLVLFGPSDTASNLDPGNPAHPDFPQWGHGSIDLTVLFNDPDDPE